MFNFEVVLYCKYKKDNKLVTYTPVSFHLQPAYISWDSYVMWNQLSNILTKKCFFQT